MRSIRKLMDRYVMIYGTFGNYLLKRDYFYEEYIYDLGEIMEMYEIRQSVEPFTVAEVYNYDYLCNIMKSLSNTKDLKNVDWGNTNLHTYFDSKMPTPLLICGVKSIHTDNITPSFL